MSTAAAPAAHGPRALPEHVEVAVVGAGFGGLGAAIELKRRGIESFVVLERAAEVGGTWWWNTYPGCQCDVPANLYSFSFARRPDWSRSYPIQPELLEYLRGCVRDFGLGPHVQLGCEVQEASWVEADRRWRIETSRGSLTAEVLIAAPGLLSEPSTPSLPGLDRFEGEAFHSARWDDDVPLAGRRVAVVGTGASAIQIVPEIQPEVERLLVFQRTPPWVIPLFDRPVSRRLRRLYRALPPVQRLARRIVYWLRETYVLGMGLEPRLLKLLEAVSRLMLRRQVGDPSLRRRLIPDYVIGCKRVLLSNRWYPALDQPNVEVVTEAVEEVRERSLVAADGSEHEVDAIVFATGFTPTDPPFARLVRGRGGRTLAETWNGSPRAHLGTTVAGFPNLFLLYGPNTNLGHSSIVLMIEAQVAYAMEALRLRRERGLGVLDVRAEAQERWNAEVQQGLRGTVWNEGGCASWYLDDNGENPIMWPGFTFSFRSRLRRFDIENYDTDARREAAEEAVGVG